MGSASSSQYPPLNKSTAPQSTLVLKTTPATGIVHIGLGNFHRAHLALYTALAVKESGGDWGIFAYSLRSTTIAHAMTSQDNLYAIATISPTSQAIIIPGIHNGAIGGPDRVAEILDEIAKESTKIISMTVTEAGYLISQNSGGLNLKAPEIENDLKYPNAPMSAIGIIVRGLEKRASNHGTPVTVLSCDNLSGNGDRTRQLTFDFIDALGNNAQLRNYVENSVTFPNSMVDRIVPGTEERHLKMVEERLGVHDASPVPAEEFSMWIIEDKFAAGRPAWEKVGAIFSDDVASYELMKLRLLNGTHSLLSYLGALAGEETIPGAQSTPFIEAAVRTVLHKEFLPTFRMPSALTSDGYISQLVGRWSNTSLGDRTSRVGSDGSTKLPQRITEPVLFHALSGNTPQFIALTVAAWLACIAPLKGFSPGEHADAMKDPAKSKLVDLAVLTTDPTVFVQSVFSNAQIFSPELSALSSFVDCVAGYLQQIINEGIEKAALTAQSRS
ncbi:MAG: mannitol dehydrogenase family protein [Actinobacteria bacterium]|nr:mannitol dehydrogenase family protein [Actinomycetota bacterium]MSX72247.1 mannitol dehydrogenase family protein [Actinomycetota bacterium]MSY69898.1 mannitol dehydrogenase family protein [Actinomycetota bacterium]MSZ00977.1 mannitol dehydrogenase family protein [Actinomycetota bacterium]MTA76242.1 mannitol dehydrogenase family protein [Actinomycetota bacterium]